MNLPPLASRAARLVTPLLLFAGSAFAQHSLAQPSPVTTQIKSAGTYHVATGTWSRGAQQLALAGPEVIYDNTCTVGLFLGLSDGDVLLDSGRIPSTSTATWGSNLNGLYDIYEVNGFTIGYCSYEPLLTNLDVSFVDCYMACLNSGNLPTPLVTISLLNAPAGTAGGSLGCWIVNVDLANSANRFQLEGDCNGAYDNWGGFDSFGWSWTQTAPSTAGNSGPLAAGDPLAFFNPSCGGIGGGTTFVGAPPGPGTGLGVLDQYELSSTVTSPGCYWFGGYSSVNAMGAFYMQLQGKQGIPFDPGAAFCFGDGTGVACPCSGFGLPGEGCANTTGTGATLVGSGSPLLSLDSFSLTVFGVPGSKPGLLLRGDNQIQIPAGDGLLCTSGASQRSQVQITSAGSTSFSDWNGSPLGSIANVSAPTNFQFWYRDPQNPCSGAGFNFTNGWTVTYVP